MRTGAYNQKQMAAIAGIDITDMLPATFTIPNLTEEGFDALCAKFPDATLEYTTDGTVLIMPPTDPESSERVVEVVTQLRNWAQREGHGRVSGPDGGFYFQDGSRRSLDAAWFDDARWRAAKSSGARFPVFAPEFVMEVRSPDDRIRVLREKMQEYIANGVKLAWLIDPLERTVEIYRFGSTPEVLTNPASVAGDGPIAGFVLPLERVFTA